MSGKATSLAAFLAKKPSSIYRLLVAIEIVSAASLYIDVDGRGAVDCSRLFAYTLRYYSCP